MKDFTVKCALLLEGLKKSEKIYSFNEFIFLRV